MEGPYTKINMETKDKIQIAVLIIISVLIIVLIMAVVVLAKNAEEIKSDPVEYAINNGFYDSCSCTNSEVGIVNFIKEPVIQNWSSWNNWIFRRGM